MTFKAVVQHGIVQMPEGIDIPDGTVVEVTATTPKRVADVMDLAGTWAGDDADEILREIHASRSSSTPRATLD